MLLASTLTIMVGFEAFFNLGVVMGILPPKGWFFRSSVMAQPP